MRSSAKLVLTLLALAGPLATGCRTASQMETGEAGPDYATLVVKNENVLSMDIYTMSNSLATRVGRVTGLGSGKFKLNSTLYVSSDFRVVGTPTSGNGQASSGRLAVHSGQTIEFTIGSRIAQSRATVREP